MAMKIFDRDLSKAEMSESLDTALQLLGVVESILLSENVELEAHRAGLLYITRDIDERVAHALESLESLQEGDAKTA